MTGLTHARTQSSNRQNPHGFRRLRKPRESRSNRRKWSSRMDKWRWGPFYTCEITRGKLVKMCDHLHPTSHTPNSQQNQYYDAAKSGKVQSKPKKTFMLSDCIVTQTEEQIASNSFKVSRSCQLFTLRSPIEDRTRKLTCESICSLPPIEFAFNLHSLLPRYAHKHAGDCQGRQVEERGRNGLQMVSTHTRAHS